MDLEDFSRYSLFLVHLLTFTPAGLLFSRQLFLAVSRLTPESHLCSHPAWKQEEKPENNYCRKWCNFYWDIIGDVQGVYLPSWLEVFLRTSTLPRSPDDMVLWIFFWSLWDDCRAEEKMKSMQLAQICPGCGLSLLRLFRNITSCFNTDWLLYKDYCGAPAQKHQTESRTSRATLLQKMTEVTNNTNIKSQVLGWTMQILSLTNFKLWFC